MIDDDGKVITTKQMILDLRNAARFVREKTPMPEEIAKKLEDVADEMEYWMVTGD